MPVVRMRNRRALFTRHVQQVKCEARKESWAILGGPVSLFVKMADGTISDPVADAVKRAKEVRLPYIFLKLAYKVSARICLPSPFTDCC